VKRGSLIPSRSAKAACSGGRAIREKSVAIEAPAAMPTNIVLSVKRVGKSCTGIGIIGVLLRLR
jgi:hypothetical protein